MKTVRTSTRFVVASLFLLTAACSSSNSSSGSPSAPPASSGESSQNVSVSLNQWSVTPSTTPGSGSVTFTVSNDGSIPHEFVVLKTDTSAADIPIGKFEGEPNRINEDTAGTNVGETGDMEPGHDQDADDRPRSGPLRVPLQSAWPLPSGMHVDVTDG
jgi:hypothetical protein